MARTQAADYEQRREAIVAKAARQFARFGFNGASVADLAKACDTSKSLIYHYYPSKEDILYAVMASHLDLLRQDVAHALASGGSVTEQLRRIVHSFMRHYVGAADAHKVLLNELDSLPPEPRAKIVQQQREIIAVVSALLAATFDDLERSPSHARASAMLLFGMINWTHTWYDPGGPIDPDTLADMALAMILREPPPG